MGMTGDASNGGPIDHAGLLRTIRALACTHLDSHWEAVLTRTDDYLFDGGLRDGENSGELTALRDMRRARAGMRERFRMANDGAFDDLCPDLAREGDHKSELRLLSDDDLEEQLSSEQMVDSLLRHHAGALELLEQRLSVLVGRSVLAGRDNPLSPMRLGETMRSTLHGASISTAVRITIYKLAEREFSVSLSALYNRVNAIMAEGGILPRLLPASPEPDARTSEPSAAQEDVRARETHGEYPGAGSPAAGDQALFSRLLELMGGWRTRGPAGGGQSGPVSAGPDASEAACLGNTDLLSVLTLLQAEPPSSLESALDDESVSLAERLRGELLMRASGLGLGDGRPSLAPAHDDAINLVGMLFEVLLDERDFERDVRRQLSRMLVPFVRVAVHDRRLFVHKAHPARRYLNAVVEACDGNHGEGAQDRALLEQVDASIARLVAGYNEDLAIFEALEEELRAYMAQMRLRIDLAERRAAEAQSGRERLEQARSQAQADIADRRKGEVLPAAIDEFLRGCAAHHLTQVALRDGRDTPDYRESVQVIEQLLAGCASTPPEGQEKPEWDNEVLRAMLRSSGCCGDTAEASITALRLVILQSATATVAAVENLVPTAAATPAAASGPVLRVVGGNDTLDYDPDVADTIRALPIGSWMQLLSESGRSDAVKVSWISPISSRLLLVNRRGIRLLVASAEELAAMVNTGRLELRKGETPFEDVLHRMVDRLQSAVA
ncbi:DUF1631 domain-containing protein [soil metagenome]